MPTTYDRKSPADYAAQRLALRLKVQEGAPVETAARVLNLPRSTARLWAAQDGLRCKDRAADAAGVARPAVGGWAREGRKAPRARPAPEETEDDLPPSDYPELKGLAPRKRLTVLSGLADMAEARAIAAIEEGCVTFGLASLREAQRLRRAWRVLRDGLELYPPLQAEEVDEDDWRVHAAEEIRALDEGREPVRPPPPPPGPKTAEDIASEEIWAAIEAAEAEDLARMGAAPEDMDDEVYALRQFDLSLAHHRMMQARRRWMSLPGRAPPPIVVHLPERKPGWRRTRGPI